MQVDRLREEVAQLAERVAEVVAADAESARRREPAPYAAVPTPATVHALLVMLGDDIADLPLSAVDALRSRADQR